MLAAAAAISMVAGVARAQCDGTEVVSGLRFPLGITLSNQNNLIVGEAGTGEPNTGRISLVDREGNRRTLLDGLPSGTDLVGGPSGPAGVFLRGRTLYVAIGVGDSALPGSEPNPEPSSPIFSSVLAVHFGANAEKTTGGFTLSPDDQEALAAGEKVTLSNGAGDKITVELVADFPDFIEEPSSPSGFLEANPYDLVVVGNRAYVTDGARNLVWEADIHSGAFSEIPIPGVPNPLPFGPPVTESVPTGIAVSGGQIFVTLLTGFPFPVGSAVVRQLDPQSGEQTTWIDGLSAAIDVIPTRTGGDSGAFVLEISTDFLADAPGRLLQFDSPDAAPTAVADCLIAPTSMVLDEKTGRIYVTSLAGGRIVFLEP